MIPLQFSCHNNDHTTQLSLGGHAAPSLTHTHRHTVFCECSHSVLCAIDSRHTHTHTYGSLQMFLLQLVRSEQMEVDTRRDLCSADHAVHIQHSTHTV